MFLQEMEERFYKLKSDLSIIPSLLYLPNYAGRDQGRSILNGIRYIHSWISRTDPLGSRIYPLIYVSTLNPLRCPPSPSFADPRYNPCAGRILKFP